MGKDWGEKFRTLGAMVAVFGALGAFLATAMNLLPFARASDMVVLASRVSVIESGFKGMSLDQKQSLELQLMQQLDTLDVKLKNVTLGTEYTDLRARRVELNQRLTNVRSDIAALRSSQ